MRLKYTKRQKKQVLRYRDYKEMTFSEICTLMNLNQRKVRSLYSIAKREQKRMHIKLIDKDKVS